MPSPDDPCSKKELLPPDATFADNLALPDWICDRVIDLCSGLSEADFSKLLQLVMKHAGKTVFSLLLRCLYKTATTNTNFSPTVHKPLLKAVVADNVIQS
jgi:hypothetical protein